MAVLARNFGIVGDSKWFNDYNCLQTYDAGQLNMRRSTDWEIQYRYRVVYRLDKLDLVIMRGNDGQVMEMHVIVGSILITKLSFLYRVYRYLLYDYTVT